MVSPHRIVVLGGGAAGLDLATRLARRRHSGFAVTLVDRNPSYIWKPRLHQVAAGTIDTGQEEVDYLVQAATHGFTYRPGIVRALDRAARTVSLGTVQDQAGQDIATAAVGYDTLIVSIGSRANDFGMPGVLEHCDFIKSCEQRLNGPRRRGNR